MESFMTLLCRMFYNVREAIDTGINSFVWLRCLDSDRDLNAARNILALGHERLSGGIPVLSA